MSSTAGRRLLFASLALAFLGLAGSYAVSAVDAWRSDPPGAAANLTALGGALAMAAVRHRRLGSSPGRPVLAVAGLAFCALILVIAHQLNLLAPVGVALVGLAAALLYLERGWQGVVGMRLPLFLLLCSVPFPRRLLEAVTVPVLDATLSVTVALLGVFGLDPETSGYTVILGGGRVTLVGDCSGLDGALLFVPLTILLLEANRPMGRGRYLALCAVALPLAFGANLTRVLVDSVLVHFGMRGETVDTAHEILGVVVLVTVAAVLYFAGRAANRAWSRSPAGVAST